tara:strand:+ start:2663 stop:3880 length:1218 start_codon:yes stop_codon:yes gene_type:complete
LSINNKNSSKYNPTQQLKYLKLQCNDLKEELYKVNASYLNLIRSYLPIAIRQAVFLLITDYNEYHVDLSSLESRKDCYSIIDQLVAKSSSTLTVEHLMHMAEDIERERNRKIQNLQVDSLLNQDLNYSDYGYSKSIEISASPPIENNVNINNFFEDEKSFLTEDLSFEIKHNGYFKEQEDNVLDDEKNLSAHFKTNNFDKVNNIKNDGIKTLRRLLLIAGGPFLQDNKEDPNINEEDTGDNQQPALSTGVSDNKFLPDNPLALFYWMNSIEIALTRNLRNLSNSINIELLRSGLINNLMPVTLLDAVISGEVNSQDSPSNLLKLEVPVTTGGINDKVEVSCLLICTSDLEFDNPRLRKCKSNLRKYRNLLIQMIKQERHWQSRSLANEVTQQWLQNPPEILKNKN